jgi:hypothetical protein
LPYGRSQSRLESPVRITFTCYAAGSIAEIVFTRDRKLRR